MTTTLTIATCRGPRVAAAIVSRGGLAITQADGTPDRYQLTHVASGRRLPLDDCALVDAGVALGVALASGVDWHQSSAEIRGALGDQARRALLHRMRLLANPPRRPRWRGGVRKPRLRPYYAAQRAAALRDIIAAGLRDYLRVSDVRRWAWDESYGALRWPRRQPCRRFGRRCRDRALDHWRRIANASGLCEEG